MPTLWVNPKFHDEVVAVAMKLRKENERLHKLVDAQQALLDQMSLDLEVARTQSRIHFQNERERDAAMNEATDTRDGEDLYRDDDASEWTLEAKYFNRSQMPKGGRWSDVDNRWYADWPGVPPAELDPDDGA